jgi:hypothetical protein
MCGIVAGLAFGKLNKRDEEIRQILLRYFTTELLVATEDRGKDATGAVVLFDDGNFVGLKRGEQVSDFLALFGRSEEFYGSLLKVWQAHDHNSRVYLGHCRQATIGDKADNENNHPIKIDNIVGVHNGSIKNHLKIIKNLGCKRDGKVDSEAIFRLLHHFTNSGKEPFTMEMMQDVVDRLEGQFAVVAMNGDNLDQIPMFRDGRPIELVLIKPYGILLAVSKKEFWDRLHFRYERLLYYNSEICRIKLPTFTKDGDIEIVSMPDDHAFIFDTSIRVTKNTSIEDLCEKKKMTRVNKMWQEPSTSTSYAYAGVHNRNTDYSSVRSWSKDKNKDKDSKKKRRVFDTLSKHYVIKEGDKILDREESITLPIDGDEKKETKSLGEVGKKSSAEIPIIDKRKLSAKDADKEKEQSSPPVKLKDHTTYEADVVDVVPKGAKVVKEPEIVEVMMRSFPQEAVVAANKALKDMPKDKKGYNDMDELLSSIEVESETKANMLGILLIANRVANTQMLNGFMAGYSVRMKEEESAEYKDAKSKNREKHIVGLKTLALLFAGFYDKSKAIGATNTAYNDVIRKKLAQLALDSDRTLDIEGLSAIFNSHEQEVLSEIKEVISQAEMVKKHKKAEK